MSRIRRRDTEPELSVRSALHCMGFRYRLDVKQLLGCPDIVMPKYRIALFVHGCFWHSHNYKSGQVRPKTNEEFWAAKRARTIQRDSESSKALAESGWRVVSLWECEINRAASSFKWGIAGLLAFQAMRPVMAPPVIHQAGKTSTEYSRRFMGSGRTTKSRRCWHSKWLRRISLRHARCAV
jgi:DNA mismatch endonuclease, patch repair protein